MSDETFDVVIIGGAMIGSSIAWHLASRRDFGGRVLVVDRDLSFRQASTSHTNSCMRQQFSTAINIRMSQYCAEFIRHFGELMGEPDAPRLHVHAFGYLYLAANEKHAQALRAAQKVQAAEGVPSRILGREEIAREWPFFNLSGIVAGSFNNRDEGYFDGATMLDWWRRMARRAGVETREDRVVGLGVANGKVDNVTLASGIRVSCGTVINAAGPRAAQVAAMAGIDLPVEPRKRYTYVISAQNPLDRDLPLTIDPTGIHMRTDGAYYMIGAAPENDPPVDPDDFEFDHSLWERRIWPVIASRIPAFETVKVVNEWVGHYAFNRLDQNAIIGPHPEFGNFHFANGFSGHGFQHAPAVGRAIAEMVCTGRYETLDLSDLGFGRLSRGKPLRESAII